MLGWGSTKPVAPKPSILPELETPATREEFETLINKKYHLLLDLEGDAGWTRVPFTHDGLNDIELFERKSEEFPLWDIVKVRTIIKAPLQKLWEMINCHDVEQVKAWQPDLQGERHVEDVGEDIRVDYMTVNCPFPVTNRAFCLVRANKSQDDGAQIHISCSINHKDCPEDKNFVRAVSIVSGWILRPIPGKDNEFSCVRIIQADSKGMIPSFLVNMFKTKAGQAVALVKSHATKK
jgi:hypothetical protein